MITYKQMLVTPGMAREWLNRSNKNLKSSNNKKRKLRRAAVNFLAQENHEGRWRETHEAIAFDKSGNIIDGQHRLEMAASGDKPVLLTIATYSTDRLAAAARPCINVGIIRTGQDNLDIEGITDLGKNPAGVIKQIAMGTNSSFGGHRMSNQVMLKYAEKYKDGLQFVDKAFGETVRLVDIAPVRAELVRAYYAFPSCRSRIGRFANILSIPFRLEKGLDVDNPVVKADEKPAEMLREWIRNNQHIRSGSGGSRTAMVYMRTGRALYAFIKGEPLAKVTPARYELFPLHGEDEERSVDMPKEDGHRNFIVPLGGKRMGSNATRAARVAIRKGFLRLGKNAQCRKVMEPGDRLAIYANGKIIGDATLKGISASPRANTDEFPYIATLKDTHAYFERPVAVTHGLCSKLSAFKDHPWNGMTANLVRGIRPVTARDFALLTTPLK